MKNVIKICPDDLTFCYHDEAFTDSKAISEGTGISHHAVMQLITNHQDDVSSFGRVAFEMQPLETNGGIQKVKICRLNEQQAYFVISMMKNTPKVVEFKKELVRQFFVMREYIGNMVTARVQFPRLTAQIKRIHENPKPYHYSNECDMINRLVTGMSAKQIREKNGLQKGESIRPYLTAEQIAEMDELQNIDTGLLVAVNEFEARKQLLAAQLERIRTERK